MFNKGSITAKFIGESKSFDRAVKNVANGLTNISSRAKSAQDRLRDLQRRKDLLTQRMKLLAKENKNGSTTYKTLQNRVENLTDRIGTQRLRMRELGEATKKTAWFMSPGYFKVHLLANALGGLLANAIWSLTSRLNDLVTGFFTLGTQTEQTNIAFEVMLGSAEKGQKMLKDLANFAKRTPFEIPQLENTSKSLLAMGFGASEIIPTLQMLGDISAGVGVDKLPFLTLALSQVKTAGKLTGAELRQFSENGIPLLEGLAKKAGVSMGVMRKAITEGEVSFEDVMEVLKESTSEGGRFFNLMERQSATLGGKWSNMVDDITIKTRDLFVKLSPIFHELFDGLSLVVGKGTDFIFDFLSKESTIRGFTNGIKFLKDNFNSLRKAIKEIPDRLNELSEWYNSNKNWVDNLAIIIASYAGAWALVNGAVAIYNGLMWASVMVTGVFTTAVAILTSPITLLILGIGSLIAIGVLLWKNWDWIMLKAGEMFYFIWLKTEGIRLFVGNIFNWISNKVMGVIDFLKLAWFVMTDFWTGDLEQKSYYIGFALGLLAKATIAIFTWIGKTITDIFTAMRDWAIQRLVDLVIFIVTMPSKIYGAVQAVGNLMVNVFAWVGRTVTNIFDAMTSWSIQNLAKIISFIIQIPFKIGGTIATIYSKFREVNLTNIGQYIVDSLIRGMKNKAGELAGAVKDMASGITRGFKDAMQMNSPSKILVADGEMIAQSPIKGIKNKMPEVRKTSQEMAEEIQAPMRDGIDKTRNRNNSSSYNNISNNNSSTLNFNPVIEFKSLVKPSLAESKQIIDSILPSLKREVSKIIKKPENI